MAKKSQVSTYDQKKQPDGVKDQANHQKPMCLFDIECFEYLKNVQINVFRKKMITIYQFRF